MNAPIRKHCTTMHRNGKITAASPRGGNPMPCHMSANAMAGADRHFPSAGKAVSTAMSNTRTKPPNSRPPFST